MKQLSQVLVHSCMSPYTLFLVEEVTLWFWMLGYSQRSGTILRLRCGSSGVRTRGIERYGLAFLEKVRVTCRACNALRVIWNKFPTSWKQHWRATAGIEPVTSRCLCVNSAPLGYLVEPQVYFKEVWEGGEEKQDFGLFVIVADNGKFLDRSQNTQREYFNILFINFYSTLSKIDGKLVNNLVVSQSVLLLKSAHVCPCL